MVRTVDELVSMFNANADDLGKLNEVNASGVSEQYLAQYEKVITTSKCIFYDILQTLAEANPGSMSTKDGALIMQMSNELAHGIDALEIPYELRIKLKDMRASHA